MAEDGTMLRGKDLQNFADEHDLKLISIAELISYVRIKKSLIEKIETTKLPTDYGDFTLHLYQDKFESKQHIALTHGKIDKKKPTLIRVHSECVTGDIFSSKRCDCGAQLDLSLIHI